jgi:hypothetical protein
LHGDFSSTYSSLPGAIVDTPSGVGSIAYLGVQNAYVIEAIRPLLMHETLPDLSKFGNRIREIEPIFKSSKFPRTVTIRSDPFETDFSIWYLLVDLWDIKKTLQKIATNMAKIPRHSLSRSDLARDFHNKHLGIRFGIIPLVSDIQDFVSTVSKWKSKYNDMDALSIRRYQSHDNIIDLETKVSGFDMDDWSETVYGTLPIFPLGGPVQVLVERTVKASWHNEALYGFQCPEFQGWMNRLAQICDSFGVLDPAAIWDVVPFSFIVDWFYSVSNWLHKNRPKLFPATAVIYDYLETVKIVSTVKYTLQNATFSAAGGYAGGTVDGAFETRDAFLGMDTYTTYLRRRFDPSTMDIKLVPRERGSNSTSFISLSNKVAIAASLIGQRLPR